MASSTDKDLEQQLLEAGNKLLDPPSDLDDLIILLEEVEKFLSGVEQSPTKSMQSALAPSLKALVTDKLFKHSDVDVKVAVASCISEITRITAPDAPYDDDQMKDVFQLIVSSFKDLDDQTCRSYLKRASILETVAKVRSCVVMLDLECDALIIEMFQHFLKGIRDYHPESVFNSMDTIMSLVLEDSEDIAPELLSPLLAVVKKGNEEVLPVARKLGEKVLESCALKVRPYLQQAVKSLDISLDEYSDVVASICQDICGSVEQSDANAAEENKVEETKPAGASSADNDKALEADAGSPKHADPKQIDGTNDKSPKSVVSNGVAQTGEDHSLADSSSLKKQDDSHQADQSKSVDMSSNADTEVLDAVNRVNEEGKSEQPVNEESKPNQAVNQESKQEQAVIQESKPEQVVIQESKPEQVVIQESKPEQATEKKEEVNSSTKSTEASESSQSGADKDVKKLPDDQAHDKDLPSFPNEEPSVEAAVSSENKKEGVSSQPPSPKTQESESMNIVSPSGRESLPDESLSKNSLRTKKKESLIKDPEPSSGDVPIKTSEGTSDSEAKPNKRLAKKALAKISNEEKTPPPSKTDATKKGSVAASESEAKPLKQSSKKVVGNNRDGSSKQSEDKKERSRGKSISEKNMSKSSTISDDKEKVSSPKSAAKSTEDEHKLEETPKTATKRKQASGDEKESRTGKDLIGLRVEVFWPLDKKFYRGVIKSYDSKRRKHEVLYDDADKEFLYLGREKWRVIDDDDIAPEEEEEADEQIREVLSETSSKKKVKTNASQSSKQGKADSSTLGEGGASSSKSKNAATKSGRKSVEVGKTDSKSANETKATKKAEDDNTGKTKDTASKSGSKDATSKSASKPKVDESASKTGKSKEDGLKNLKTSSKSKQETTKSGGKSKQETPKATSNAKGKSLKSGEKSSANGTGKLKSGSSKVKETEERDEESTDSEKLQETLKRRLKGQGSEVKSGAKKRRKVIH